MSFWLIFIAEDALQIIAEKQNEMIDAQTKLDDAAHVQLEFQELRGTVIDLTVSNYLFLFFLPSFLYSFT